MTCKLLRLALTTIVGCASITPFVGCGGGDTASSKPTIDMSTPIKTPDKPSTSKVEVMPKAKR